MCFFKNILLSESYNYILGVKTTEFNFTLKTPLVSKPNLGN